MTTNLRIEQIDAVSVVDKGANNRSFFFWKRAKPEGESIEKAATFLDSWEAQQTLETFYDAFWLIDDLLWDVRWNDDIVDKAAYTKQVIAEFAAVVSGQIEKRGAEFVNGDVVSALAKRAERIEKAGARHSKQDKELIAQMRALLEQLDDPPEESASEDVDKREVDVTPEEMQAAITEAVTKAVETAQAPLLEKVASLETQLGEQAETLGKRVEELEAAPGSGKSLKGQEIEKRDDTRWPSFFPE